MEAAFGEDFSKVQIEQSPRAEAATAALGTIAAATQDHIFLGRGFFSHRPAYCRRVLAHELAHVVQKRRFGSAHAGLARNPVYRSLIEAEAHRAADNAVRGRPATVVLADEPDALAAWGPAGHYYTSYFVMLAAGVSPNSAQYRAFFCQMPDQVYEFDAIAAAVDYGFTLLGKQGEGGIGNYKTATPPYGGAGKSCVGVPNPDLHYEHRTKYEVYSDGLFTTVVQEDVSGYYFSSLAKQREVDRDISEGLHSLTGGWAKTETMFREQMLRESVDDLTIGLALHPYGDSFAHRQLDDGNLMYDPFVGHGVEVTTGRAHDPDNIGVRFKGPALYPVYVANLYKLMRDRPDCGAVRMSLPDTQKALSQLNNVKVNDESEGEDKEACKELIEIAARTKSSISFGAYRPEVEVQSYWCQFWPTHKATMAAFGGQEAVFKQVRKCGHDWYIKRLSYASPTEKSERKAAAEAAAEARRKKEIERRWDRR